MQELLEKLSQAMAENIERHLRARLENFFISLFKNKINIIFSEDEAAKFLKIETTTLQKYRRDGLLNFYQYPGERVHVYSLDMLLDFLERRKVKKYPEVFEIVPQLSLLGVEVRDKRTFKKSV